MIQDIQFLLRKAGFKNEVMEVVNNYSERNRFYHDFRHIEEMLYFVNSHFIHHYFSTYDQDAIRLAVVFHDVIYDIHSKTNEEDSAQAFVDCIKKYATIQGELNLKMLEPVVVRLILATKRHEFEIGDELSKLIIRADLDRFTRPFPEMWGHYLDLFKEYGPVEFADFKKGRADFLDSYKEKLDKFMPPIVRENIQKQITVLETWKPKIAVYPGSFKPFHVGHENILKKAEKIFDKVIIACGKNSTKDDVPHRIPDSIRRTYQVDEYNGLLTDYVSSKEYPVTVIRGLRDIHDLTAEITQYHWLQELMPHIDVVSIFCDREYEHVSSSAIRQLEKYKGDFYENPFFEKFRVK